MSKAILMKSGNSRFFIEVEEQIQIPNSNTAQQGQNNSLPNGMEHVVSSQSMNRELSEVKSLITTVCNGLFEAVSSIPKPKEFVAEFGIKIAGETGVPFITKASAEGNFKVSIKWSLEE